MENSIKCLSQGHSDMLLHRESNQGFATFRLLARFSNNWTMPLPELCNYRFKEVRFQETFICKMPEMENSLSWLKTSFICYGQFLNAVVLLFFIDIQHWTALNCSSFNVFPCPFSVLGIGSFVYLLYLLEEKLGQK